MNANELAEILEDVGMEQKHYDTIQKVATMLRQQQEEIEALKSKTLTDEEDTECQYCKQGCIRCDARKALTDEEIIEIWSGMETDTGEQNIAFARAILKKAQND